MKFFAVIISVALGASAFPFHFADSVTEIDLQKYTGRWYNVLGSPFVKYTISSNAYCIAADYALTADGKVSVFNQQHKGSVDGKLDTIKAFGQVPDPAYPGRLAVTFPGGNVGDYWITALGPVNADNLYDYAIVSDRFKVALFVLTRDVPKYYSTYEEEVAALLKDQGFTHFWNMPLTLPQPANCKYADAPTA